MNRQTRVTYIICGLIFVILSVYGLEKGFIALKGIRIESDEPFYFPILLSKLIIGVFFVMYGVLGNHKK